MTERAGDGVNDGVPPACEGKVGKAHALLPCQSAAPVASLGKSAEEVGPGVSLGFIELLMQVIFKHRALFELTPSDLEYMDTPADPGFRLALGGVEQVGQCAGLDGQGEVVNDFDGVSGEGLGNQAVHHRLDLGHDGRVFGALEEGLHDLPVVGVLRRIGFNGQLAHGAHIFLRGDGYAEGCIRAEGLPVFGSFSHVFMTQDHGDGLTVERALHHTRFLAGILEGVGKSGHGVAEGHERLKVDSWQCSCNTH